MDEYTTQRRMRSHIVITLCVLWAISMHYGSGFGIVTLGPVQLVVPNWAAFVALGIGIVGLRRYRDQVLPPVVAWMGWVLTGEEEV